MLVRDAHEGDLEALLALYVQLSAGNASTTVEAARPGLQALLADERVRLLVAEDEGRVVGTATLVVVPNLTHDGQPWAQVENVVVEDSLRGTGVGRLVMDECVRLAWAAGCYKVQLQSADHREGAHRFYEGMGFKASSLGFRLYRGGPHPLAPSPDFAGEGEVVTPEG
ncbi:MAG: GNAT family N-acetyltransferase [Tepidiformaceae bacterium]